MIDKKSLTDIINKALEGADMFLVDVQVSATNDITVEVDSLNDISIDECAKLNREIESKFDRDKEDYQLEVGSAGLTSPFKVKAQYDKYIGKEVEVLTADGLKAKGVLKSAGDSDFTIVTTVKEKPEGAKRPILVEKDETFKYENIKYTKYLIQFK